EYLNEWTVKNLVKKYSDYIRYPINMEVTKSRKKEDSPEDKPEYESYKETETLNSMTPLWKKAKSEVKTEEYNEFYKEKFGDYQDPVRVIRSSTEGTATYTSLMFIPKKAPYDYYSKEFEKGLQLYASGVLIMEKCSDLLPDYFSFVKGLVDSQDLSLNISREMLQHDRQLKLIATSLEKKIKSELEGFMKNDREGYDEFFKEFGRNLKYGLYSDYGMHKDILMELVMFASSTEKKLVTLKEYVSRMKEDQKFIYYAAGESVNKLDMLPQTEALKEKGFEILYLTEDVDEFCLKMLQKYEDKDFKNVSDGDLGLETEEEKEAGKKQNDDNKELLDIMKEALGDKVKEVRLSSKLKTHPVCLSTDGEVSIEMEKVLNSMPTDQKVKAERVLELNANHKVFETLTALAQTDKEKLKDYASILYSQALLIEGLTIEDPVEYANKVCELL
ncbi:MAG: molecular chaperone HtpG, partial [Oscillospiraceae bacterium]